jgi:hypothetical protein
MIDLIPWGWTFVWFAVSSVFVVGVIEWGDRRRTDD